MFINPDFPGVKAKSFGVILTFARMVEVKHLKLPATVDAPTDVYGEVPRPTGSIQVGRSDDKMSSIEQICHSRTSVSLLGSRLTPPFEARRNLRASYVPYRRIFTPAKPTNSSPGTL